MLNKTKENEMVRIMVNGYWLETNGGRVAVAAVLVLHAQNRNSNIINFGYL